MARRPWPGPRAVLLAVVFCGSLFAGSAWAEGGLTLDSDSLTGERAEDGSVTASVVITNSLATLVTLDARVRDDADLCNATIAPRTLAAGLATKVTLTIEEACFPQAALSERTFTLTDGTQRLPAVTVKPPESTTPTWPLWVAGLLAVCLGAYLWNLGVGALRVQDDTLRDPASIEARRKQYEALQAVVDERIRALNLPAEQRSFTGPTPPWTDLADPPAYGLGSTIKGLEATWSLNDSWVSTITVAVAGVTGLLQSTDLFTTLVGDAPKGALGLMTVAGLISAAWVALALVLVKVIGPKTSEVTVGGFLASNALIAAAVTLQLATIALAALQGLRESHPLLAAFVAIAAAASLAVALVYAKERQRETITEGADDGAPVLPEDPAKAWASDRSNWQRRLVFAALHTEYSKFWDVPAVATAGSEVVVLSVPVTSLMESEGTTAALM